VKAWIRTSRLKFCGIFRDTWTQCGEDGRIIGIPFPILPAYITRLFFPRCNPLSSLSLLSGRESQKRLFRFQISPAISFPRHNETRTLSSLVQTTYRWLVPNEKDGFFLCPREAHSAHSTHLLSHQWKIVLWKFVCLALSLIFILFLSLDFIPNDPSVSNESFARASRLYILPLATFATAGIRELIACGKTIAEEFQAILNWHSLSGPQESLVDWRWFPLSFFSYEIRWTFTGWSRQRDYGQGRHMIHDL